MVTGFLCFCLLFDKMIDCFLFTEIVLFKLTLLQPSLMLIGTMKTIFTIIFFLLYSVAFAGGPVLPNGYRIPNKKELSSVFRSSDRYKFSMAIGDFNGDGLFDGVQLAVAPNQKEIAVYAFLCTKDDQVYKWFKLETLDYVSIHSTGLRGKKPQRISYYPDIKNEKTLTINLKNDFFELFQFEGASSVFYYDPRSESFERIWVSK